MAFNFKELIQELKKPEWHYQEMTGCLNLASVCNSSVGDTDFKRIILVSQNDKIFWTYSRKILSESAARLVKKELKHPGNFKKLFNSGLVILKKYKDFYSLIDEVSLKRLTDKQLKNLYQGFIKISTKFWHWAASTELFSFYGEEVVLPYCQKIFGNDSNRIFQIMISPEGKSFGFEEEEDLLKIIKLFENKKTPRGIIDKKLKQHADKFFWIKNNYLKTPKLGPNHFLSEIKKKIKEGIDPNLVLKEKNLYYRRLKKEKHKISEQYHFDNFLKTTFKMLALAGYWQDIRKKNNLIGDYYLNLFLKEVSRRKKINFKDSQYALPEEVVKILSGQKINPGIFKIRKKNGMAQIFEEGHKETILTGKKATLIKKTVAKTFFQIDSSKILTGISASLGKIKGRVRIIYDPKKSRLLKKGEIMVTFMTRPEFLPILKNASGLITDEGGVTCHAAIVARELGIPCIIGTRVATKILKDGDLVEVDADQGIVRRIK